jgi:hypothetical protein
MGLLSRPVNSRIGQSSFHPDPFVHGGWEGHHSSGVVPGQPTRRLPSPAAHAHAEPNIFFPVHPPQAVAPKTRRRRSNVVGGSGRGLREEYGIGQAGTPHLSAIQKEDLKHTSFLKRFFGYDDSQVSHA